MKKLIIAVLMFTAVLSAAAISYAQTAEATGMTAVSLKNFNNYINAPLAGDLGNINLDESAYANSPAEKAGKGAINTATAWTDIPKQITQVTDQSNMFIGLTVGFTKGLATGLARTVAGVYQIATGPIPPYDKPLVKPEYKSVDSKKELQIKVLNW